MNRQRVIKTTTLRNMLLLCIGFTSLCWLFVVYQPYFNIPAVLFLSLALVLVAEAQRESSDLFSPVRIYIIVWFGTIGVSLLRLSGLQQEWTSYTWLVIATSILCYIGGAFTGLSPIITNKNINLRQLIRHWESPRDWSIKRLVRATIALFLLSLAGFALEMHINRGIPLLMPNPDMARQYFGLCGIHLLTISFRDVLILIVIYILVQGPRLRHMRTWPITIVTCIIALISLLCLFATTNRGDILFTFIIALVIYHYFKKPLKLKQIITAVFLFLLIFIGIGLLREKAYEKYRLYRYAQMNIPIKYSWLTGLYTYVAMNFENLQNLIHEVPHFTYGAHSLQPVLALTRLKNLVSPEFLSNIRSTLHYPLFKTGTYLTSLYADFGFVGIATFPFIFGWLNGFIYCKMLTERKTIYVLLYAFLMLAVILSFFSFFFSRLNFLFNAFVLYLVHLYCKRLKSTTSKGRPQQTASRTRSAANWVLGRKGCRRRWKLNRSTRY